MSAAVHNIEMDQGAQFVLPLRFYSDAAKTTLIDYSAYTAARMQVRKTYGSDSAVVELLMSASEIVLTDDAGPDNVTVTISTVKSRLIPAGFVGVYDLLLTDAAGEDERVLQGSFTANPRTTLDV